MSDSNARPEHDPATGENKQIKSTTAAPLKRRSLALAARAAAAEGNDVYLIDPLAPLGKDKRAMRDTDYPTLRGVSQKALPQPNEAGEQHK